VLGELVLMRLMPENRSESGFRLPALLENREVELATETRKITRELR